jgi:hypothetical protein
LNFHRFQTKYFRLKSPISEFYTPYSDQGIEFRPFVHIPPSLPFHTHPIPSPPIPSPPHRPAAGGGEAILSRYTEQTHAINHKLPKPLCSHFQTPDDISSQNKKSKPEKKIHRVNRFFYKSPAPRKTKNKVSPLFAVFFERKIKVSIFGDTHLEIKPMEYINRRFLEFSIHNPEQN